MLDGRGSLEVGRDEVRLATLLLEPVGELGRRGRLTRTLETSEQDDRRGLAGIGDRKRRATQNFDELIVNRLDDLLARSEALGEHFTTQAFAHRVEERAHHAQFHVRFEQGGSHVREGSVEVRVAQSTLRTQART